MDTQIVTVVVAFVVSIVIETAIGTIVGLIIKRQFDKRQEERKKLEALEEQQRIQAEDNRCQVVKNTIHNEMEGIKAEFKADIKPLQDDLVLMKKTMQKDTRRSLRQDADVYIKRGWVSAQEKTEYDELYWCYHNLGRNGVVDADHDAVMHLPTSKGE